MLTDAVAAAAAATVALVLLVGLGGGGARLGSDEPLPALDRFVAYNRPVDVAVVVGDLPARITALPQ
jgi:hypothetical protein